MRSLPATQEWLTRSMTRRKHEPTLSTLALVCLDAGLEGLVFDNEEYDVHWWRYPNDCKYASTKTASQYREQWRLGGTQVMQAIIAQRPRAKSS